MKNLFFVGEIVHKHRLKKPTISLDMLGFFSSFLNNLSAKKSCSSFAISICVCMGGAVLSFGGMALAEPLVEPGSGTFSHRPITMDSRIKTFVFNENEVFRFVVHHGFQSSIEFQEGEEVETISVGEVYAWRLTPIGRRLFIKALEENIHTNMTIITNRRTYQFEVLSRGQDSEMVDGELAYVVRFYYPPGMDTEEDDTTSQNAYAALPGETPSALP